MHADILKVFYSNIRSLPNKINDLLADIQSQSPDIVCFTETWLNSSVDSSFLQISGFNFLSDLRVDRTDTAGGRGGGVAVYTRTDLLIEKLQVNCGFSQYVAFKVENSINLCIVYHSPNSTEPNNISLNHLIELLPYNTIVVGDFNYPSIDWIGKHATGTAANNFLSCIEENGYDNQVVFPTHNQGNVLDLVLTNNNNNISYIDNLGFLANSDHVAMVIGVISYVNNASNRSRAVLKWQEANYQGMFDFLNSVDWRAELSHLDTAAAWLNLFLMLYTPVV